jgi:hypothetical protein
MTLQNKKIMKQTIYTFIVFVLLASCTKDNSTSDPASLLPPETQTGANTFGCLINGKLLIPRDGSGTFGVSGGSGFEFLGGYPDGAYNEINVHDYKSVRTAKILIHIQNLRQIGVATYVIDESNGMSNIDGFDHNYLHCRVFNDATNSYQYYRSYHNSGVLKITKYDFNNRIISGVFSCKVRNSVNLNDEIEIKQGRFDIKWDTLPNKIFP